MIAQISPLYESVPPSCYGGTERVVHALTEQLVAIGHEVTLFATGDSRAPGRLVPVYPKAVRLDCEVRDPIAWHILELAAAYEMAEEFDIIHSHVDYFPFAARASRPTTGPASGSGHERRAAPTAALPIALGKFLQPSENYFPASSRGGRLRGPQKGYPKRFSLGKEGTAARLTT